MKVISTDKAPAAIGPYSQAIVSGGMVYTSGQIAIDPATGAVVSGGIEEQTEQVCRNIEQLLKAAGTDIGRVVKTVCFLADMGDFAAFNAVAVKTLPKNVLVEIDTVTEV